MVFYHVLKIEEVQMNLIRLKKKQKKKMPGLSDYSEITSRRRKHKVSVKNDNTIDAVDQMS